MSFITLLFTATLLALSSAAPYYYPGSISSPSDYYPFEDFARARSQFSVSWSPGEKAFLQGVLNELTENEKAILQRITVSWGNKEKALLQGLLDDLNEDEKAALQRFSVSWNREWASRQQAVPDYNQLFKIFRKPLKNSNRNHKKNEFYVSFRWYRRN